MAVIFKSIRRYRKMGLAGHVNERFPTRDSSYWLVHSFFQESTEVLLVLTPCIE